ncbi:MAG: hypothetical protein ABNH38_01415 [Tateyamaria sp.]|uniref:hypothetical protein n=1 Tax=Tateyamaria sp. TaxID=1929288 RepID=UPI0032DD77FC
MTTRREIVLINKNEGGPPSLLDKIEKVAKIVSVVALPLVVGIGGWWIQDALSRRDTDQDYVELAISILSKPQDETQTDLREWAASLLAETSPIEIPESLRERLGGGEVQLPSIPRSPEFAPVSVTFTTIWRNFFSGKWRAGGDIWKRSRADVRA